MIKPIQALRNYPVQRYNSGWDEAQWNMAKFHPAVQTLIEKVAADWGRADFVYQLVPLSGEIVLSLPIDAEGNLSYELATSAQPATAFAFDICRAMRVLARDEAARLIRQVDIPDENGTVRRTVVVRWDRQRKTVAAQLKALHRAIYKRSQYAIETAWFGVTPHAQNYLRVGFELARRRGDLDRLTGEFEVIATVIPIPMPSPELLALILPYSEMANSFPGRRPVHARDEALTEVLKIFNCISGSSTGSSRRGDQHEPVGPGADFIVEIEAIFNIPLMTRRSTHAVARAMRRLANRRA